jgi:PAS domain S-box-containing protein
MPSEAPATPAAGRSGWSLRAKGIVLISILVLPLVASSIAFDVATHARNEAAAAIDHSLAVGDDVRDALTALLDAETGVRGYVATGDSVFLDPYRGVGRRVRDRLRDLRRLVAGDAVQERNLDTVTARVGRELDSLAGIIHAGSRPASDDQLLRGKALMDDTRIALGRMRARETADLDASRATRSRIIRQTSAVIVAGLVLGLIGVVVAMILSTTWVMRRMRALERNAERLAAEQPVEPVPAHDDEIGRVEEAIATASDLLRERRERLSAAMEWLAQQNEAVRESELRYRTLARNIPNPLVMMYDRDLRFTMAEGAALDPARGDRSQYEGRTLWEIMPPDQAERLAAEYRKAFDGESVVFEWPIGEQHWLLSVSPVRDEASGIVGGVVVSNDVTALKKAREELLRERGMLQAVLDNMVEGVVMANADGEFLVFNPAAERILGVGASDGGPDAWTEDYGLFLSDGETPFPSEQLPLTRALHGETPEEVEMVSRHADRPDGVVLEVSARPIGEGDGSPMGALAVFRDVTEKHRVEEELADRRAELERSNAELEQFAYVASHDLQEPLRMVASYTQLLARRYGGRLDEDADEFIGYAVDGATRMQALINDLLAYSRVQRKELELATVDSGDAVDAALANLRGAIEDREAAVVVDDELPEVRGDLTQLTQLFQNLLGNALKFTNGARPEVHVGVRRRPEEWVFSVSDNGIGIDPQHTDRIFEVFQRLHTRQEYPGTGIGLAVCKKIVERIGGRIWVQSSPGEGATFSFAIPTERRSGRARVPNRRG